MRFENAAKVKLNAIHYRGATPAQNDVMGGHTNMMMVSVSLALPTHRDGKVKMFSIGSAKRLPQLPEFPTTAEAGNMPGYIAGTWFGLAVTAGTPRPIVDKINADVRAILAEPAFKERFLDRQFFERMDSSPEEFRDLIRAETQTWAQGDPRAEPRDRPALAHVPEKWAPAFRKGHAQTQSAQRIPVRPNRDALSVLRDHVRPVPWRALIVGILVWSAGAAIFFRYPLFSFFDAIVGDGGDGRMLVYLHEHLFNALRGRASLTSPPFYFPQQDALGLGPAFLLDVIPYSILRFLGFDPFLSFQIFIILLSLACFLAILVICVRYLNIPHRVGIVRRRLDDLCQQSVCKGWRGPSKLAVALLLPLHRGRHAVGP